MKDDWDMDTAHLLHESLVEVHLLRVQLLLEHYDYGLEFSVWWR